MIRLIFTAAGSLACIAALPLSAQTTYPTGGATFIAASRAEGAVYTTQGISSTLTAWPTPDGQLRWIGNHSTVDVTYYAAADALVMLVPQPGSGVTLCLYQDAILYGTCITGAGDSALHTSSGQWTGLSGTHNYSLVNVGTNATSSVNTNGYLNIFTAIILGGGTGAISQPSERPLIVGCSDSIYGYQSSLIFDARLGDFWQIAASLGYSDLHYGDYGALVTGDIKTACPTMVTNVLASAPASSYIVSTGAGVNDANASVALGSPGVGCTTGTVECDYYNMVGAFWTANPQRVLVRSILPNSYTTSGMSLSPNIAVYNVGILASVNQWNADNPTKITCDYATLNWFDPITGTVSDHLHPTVASYTAMQNHEIPIYAAASFSVSTPTTGTTSTATLTLAGAATLADSLTATSSNLTDMVCLGATCGTGSVTLTTGGNTVTQSVSGAAGSRTITYSGPQCWTFPSPVSVTLTSSTAGVSLSGVTIKGVTIQ